MAARGRLPARRARQLLLAGLRRVGRALAAYGLLHFPVPPGPEPGPGGPLPPPGGSAGTGDQWKKEERT